MCNQYTPAKSHAIADHFGVPEPAFNYPARTYKGYVPPMLCRPHAGKGLVLEEGHFALVPFFAKTVKLTYDTLNARSETIATAASYRGPWKRRQFCLIPRCVTYNIPLAFQEVSFNGQSVLQQLV
ncbi:MAG: SOS response-associated peptidase family protein [Rhodoferax sp.]|nr:SOS response-associated peptidase family protein [Rhodoferax sp.]